MAAVGSPKPEPEGEAAATPQKLPLRRVLALFLKIGAIGFGGGMAIIALMEQTFVRKHRALSSDEFLHGVGLAQILGPFAVNTSLFVGYRLHGPVGGLLSMTAFIAPSVALVILLSWLYFTYQALPALQGAMAGLSAVVIGLIASAAWSIGEKAVRAWRAAILAAGAFLAGLYKISPLYILVAAGLAGLLLLRQSRDRERAVSSQRTSAPLCFLAAKGIGAGAGISWMQLTLAFLKVGVMFLGGGFVVIPILYQQLVVERGWLTSQEFLDGVAISNLTPGPVSVVATFAGYRLNGVAGAVLATLALYAPAIVVMLALCHGYALAGKGRRTRDFLAGVAPAVVGLIASAACLLGRTALTSWPGCLLAAVAFLLLVRLKCSPALVLAFGGALGIARIIP